MKPYEIREKSLEEVKNDLIAAEENLQTIRFQLVTSQLENTSLFGNVRKEVSRLKTIIREHELGIRKLSMKNSPSDEEERI